ncbi:MAG: aldo/keto reductase [Halobacteriovoraceae bacterium]|nr:aldo/keto reductase [Halobacteriovoraceae bacterium]
MNRREVLKYLSMLSVAQFNFPLSSFAATDDKKKLELLTKIIPSTGEKIPAVGMGTWITFNIGQSKNLLEERAQVLKKFFELGGTLIDSSPMYGSSEKVVGELLEKLNKTDEAFCATKIWTSNDDEGKEQFKTSQKLWGVDKFELQQVHNLVNYDQHIKFLRAQKEQGKVKYIGITTSHGRRHDEIEKLLKKVPLDFVQLTYNLENSHADKKLLDLAQEKKVAVIANRPFGGGSLIDRLQRRPLPAWAKEVGIKTWADFLLKYIISHPAITCAIPATTKVEHMQENMMAAHGEYVDEKMRIKMKEYFLKL